MISVLIPIFNFNVCPLVAELQQQCRECGVPFEIRCYDDGSTAYYKEINRSLNYLEGVCYREMPENKGRAAIRNALAADALFDALLFLDNDGLPENGHFIRNYIETFDNKSVLYGGRSYQLEPPSDLDLLLHWKYGIKREVLAAAKRRNNPYHGFQTNNFMIPATLLRAITFNETLKNYGHEDTLFGGELLKSGVPIIHIDNPYRHIGLEKTAIFLEKQQQALKNLAFLHQSPMIIRTKLLSFYSFLSNWKLISLTYLIWKLFKPLLLYNLQSPTPRLIFFDFYRLGWFIYYMRL